MAATTRLTRAALALLLIFAAESASAQARSALSADSIYVAVKATDTALFGRVLEVATDGSSELARVRVLETLRGRPLPEHISVVATAAALLKGDVHLETGETVLLLVAKDGAEFILPPLRSARVPVAGVAEQGEARAVLRGYLDFVSGRDEDAFDDLLRRSAAVANPRLRAGVLADLTRRLGADDAPFLLGLAQRQEATQDVRLFAIHGLAGLASPVPTGLADLLRPAEPVAIRQAVINAFAAHRAREVVERGLADPSEEVRKTAVENLTGSEAVAVLESHFARESEQAVQLAIVRQLGLIGTAPSRSALQRILASTSDAAIHRAGAPWLETGR